MPKQSVREELRVDPMTGSVELSTIDTKPPPRLSKKKALASFARDQARLANL
jgi:hypothetical protein